MSSNRGAKVINAPWYPTNIWTFYLTTWFPASCGPPETSPQSTPDPAAAVVRSDPLRIPGGGSRRCTRCWIRGPTAASIRIKSRTGQPWRCATASPGARLFTEQRAARSRHSEQLLGRSFTCHRQKKARLLPGTPANLPPLVPNSAEICAK